MGQVLFSVIIPLYNKQGSIEKTLKTVLAQTVSNLEVLVVNDGSTDDSAQLVLTNNDERIRLITQENQGVSVARNRGISEAVGKYIAFLDADDEWSPNFLEVCLELFKKYPTAKMVSPSYAVKYEKKIVLPEWKGVDLETEDCLINEFLEMATGSFWTVTSSCVALERETLLKMERWFPEGERVYEDFDLWLRFGVRHPVAHSNKVCATYNRITPSNARKTHRAKVVYSTSYYKTLDELLRSENYDERQKLWVRQIRDRRQVVYIFSLLCTKNRKEARKVLKTWVPTKTYKKYRFFLNCAVWVPSFLITIVQNIRYKTF